MSDNRPSVYKEDDVWVFRASALGNCDSWLIREALGYTPEPWPDSFQKKFEDGTRLEPEIIYAVVDDGGYEWIEPERLLQGLRRNRVQNLWSSFEDQLEIVTPVGSKAIIRCHPDGIINDQQEGQNRVRVLECKAVTEDYYEVCRKNMPEHYKWQLSCEMTSGIHKWEAIYAWGIKEGEDGKAELKEVIVQEYKEPPYSFDKIKARVLNLLRMIEECWEDERKIPKCTGVQFPCPMYQFHLKEPKERTGIVVPEDRAGELQSWIKSYRANKSLEKKHKEQADDQKKKVLEIIEEKGMPEDGSSIEIDGMVISRREGRMGISVEKAEERGWDLEKIKVAGKSFWEFKEGKKADE